MSDRTDDPKADMRAPVSLGITDITHENPKDRVYVKVYDYAGKTIFHGLSGSVRVEVLGPKEKP